MFYQIHHITLFALNRLAMHEESSTRREVVDDVHDGAVPAYLMDRETATRARTCLVWCCVELVFFLVQLMVQCNIDWLYFLKY